jgi:molybdenum cofactor guanylyltransferase
MQRVDTAVILCGGASTRAGRDKELLPCGGTILPMAIARKLETAFREIIIATNRPGLYEGSGFTVVEDIVKGLGPLGGILGALRASTGDYAYVTAGDMPYPNLDYISWMKKLLESGEFEGIATREGEGHAEPFNSIFSPGCAASIEESLARGERSVSRFIRGRERFLLVEEKTARAFSPDWSMFWNINTRAEVEAYSHSMVAGGLDEMS